MPVKHTMPYTAINIGRNVRILMFIFKNLPLPKEYSTKSQNNSVVTSCFIESIILQILRLYLDSEKF